MRALGGNIAERCGADADDSALRLSVAFYRAGHPVPTPATVAGEAKDALGVAHCVDPAELERLLDAKLRSRNLKGQGDAVGKHGVIAFEGVPQVKGGVHLELWDGENIIGPIVRGGGVGEGGVGGSFEHAAVPPMPRRPLAHPAPPSAAGLLHRRPPHQAV